MCREVKETPYVQELYRQTDAEDNAYERTYMRAQAKVAYIDGSISVSVFSSGSVSVSVSGSVSVVQGIAVSGSVSVAPGIASYVRTDIKKS